METVQSCLASILEHLRTLQRPVERLLRPGLTVDQIVRAEQALALKLPQDVVDLWSGCGGTKVGEGQSLDDAHFFPGYYMLCAEDSVFECGLRRDRHAWQADWVPLFANGGGDFYVASGSHDGAPHSPVWLFQVGEGPPEIGFKSLTHMLNCLARSFDEGIFFVDRQAGYLEMDDRRFWNLADSSGSTL